MLRLAGFNSEAVMQDSKVDIAALQAVERIVVVFLSIEIALDEIVHIIYGSFIATG